MIITSNLNVLIAILKRAFWDLSMPTAMTRQGILLKLTEPQIALLFFRQTGRNNAM